MTPRDLLPETVRSLFYLFIQCLKFELELWTGLNFSAQPGPARFHVRPGPVR